MAKRRRKNKPDRFRLSVQMKSKHPSKGGTAEQMETQRREIEKEVWMTRVDPVLLPSDTGPVGPGLK